MKEVLLFYKKFVGDLITIVSKQITYGPYFANKVFNGKKWLWCVIYNDVKVIHKIKNIVTRKVKWLEKTYKRLFRMDQVIWRSLEARSTNI